MLYIAILRKLWTFTTEQNNDSVYKHIHGHSFKRMSEMDLGYTVL